MTSARRLWLVPALALVLAGCGGEPRAELRGDVEAITLAANDRDADAVRQEVEDLLSTIRAQIASGELDRAEGDRLRAIALRIAEQVGLLEPAESPSPLPSPSEEPSPTPEPSPSEEPSPTPEPSPSEEPSPSPEPVEEPPSPLVEISPAAQGEPEPSPSAASANSKKDPSPEPSPQPTT